MSPTWIVEAVDVSAKVLIGAELGPVNYRPQFLVAVDITRAGLGSTPAPIVTPLRRSFLNFLQDVTAHPSSDVTPAPIHRAFPTAGWFMKAVGCAHRPVNSCRCCDQSALRRLRWCACTE